MNYTQQIVESIKASAVEKILVVDDAYDPPDFDPQIAGELVNILNTVEFRAHVTEDFFSEEKRESAVTALTKTELDDVSITDALAALYDVFVRSRLSQIDPGGFFNATKGSALDVLEPMLELLRLCCGEQVLTVGASDAAIQVYRDLKPDIIFMDFYLSLPSRPTVGVTRNQKDEDRLRSIDILERMLSNHIGKDPAIILISSEDVADSKRTYLGSLKNRVMSLRFGYMHKRWISGAGQTLSASFDASDVLMDMSGSLEFARTLEVALKTWRTGVEEAFDTLNRELEEFDIKDFAYLLRFRLYDEGEPFADYLEWFLGESLRAIVDGTVMWTATEFSRLLDDVELTKTIEGAHPLPSDQISKFFHRLRFNPRRSRPRERFALGDLFISPERKFGRMVISPDCDLVPRRGKIPTASRILTIGGTIRNLHEDGIVAGDIIFHESLKTIEWNCKDLMTHEFGCTTETLDVGGTNYKFFASMRPMFAQTIQKAALADLSRIGIAVPPTVYVSAPVRVYVKKKVDNQARFVELEELSDHYAQIFIPRGGRDVKKRALFMSKFVRDLLDKLEEGGVDQLLEHHRVHWHNFMDRTQDVREEMLRKGLLLPDKGIFGVKTSFSDPKGENWLQIVVDVPDEARINLGGEFPLDEGDES